MQPGDIEHLQKLMDTVVTYGGAFCVFFGTIVIGFWYTVARLKKNLREIPESEVVKARAIVRQLDDREIEASQAKAKAVQSYLDRIAPELFAQGIDRVTVWLNHNGTRSGSFHFLFYSLVAEAVNASSGAPSFGTSRLSPIKLPYYVFSDYEGEIASKGSVFRRASELSGAAAALARDYGTKSVAGWPILSAKPGKLDGIVFAASCRKELESAPDMAYVAADVRSLLSPLT